MPTLGMTEFVVTSDGVCVVVHDPIDAVAQSSIEGTLREVRSTILNVLMSHPSIELDRALRLIDRELLK